MVVGIDSDWRPSLLFLVLLGLRRQLLGTGGFLLTLCPNLFVAVWAAELATQPLLKAIVVESVAAVRQHLHFLSLGEVSEADGATLVLKDVLSVTARGY